VKEILGHDGSRSNCSGESEKAVFDPSSILQLKLLCIGRNVEKKGTDQRERERDYIYICIYIYIKGAGDDD